MLSYRIVGRYIEVQIGEHYEMAEMRQLFEQIRNDANLPADALLLVDASRRHADSTESDVRERARAFFDVLSGHVIACALIVDDTMTIQSRHAQALASAEGLRIGLFTDEASARRWLSAYE